MTIAKNICEQLNQMLMAKKGQAELLQHNLEKGLGNEQAMRDLLMSFLPGRFGVAKGKIVNAKGQMSRQLDVIIYDTLTCPRLFVDENENQILPIEGVFEVVEVKTTLSSTTLKKAFENLQSVYELAPRINASLNDFIVFCPPLLSIFAFNDARSLEAVRKQFVRLSDDYPVTSSSSAYSPESPGYQSCNGKTYLVSDVTILNRGSVFHMYSGDVGIGDYGEYALGMFITGIVTNFDRVRLPPFGLLSYLNYVMVNEWRSTDLVGDI